MRTTEASIRRGRSENANSSPYGTNGNAASAYLIEQWTGGFGQGGDAYATLYRRVSAYPSANREETCAGGSGCGCNRSNYTKQRSRDYCL
jgi:hypothetical protein